MPGIHVFFDNFAVTWRRQPPAIFRILSGSVTAPLGRFRSLFQLVDRLHAGHHLPDHGVLAVQAAFDANIMKNCELAELGSLVRAMPTYAARKRHVGEFCLQVGCFEPPVPLPNCPSPALRHEAGDHAVERHVL